MSAKFSRQHYIVLAEAIQSARKDAESAPGVVPESWDVPMKFVTERIARALAADNPRFSREHFLAVVHGQRAITSRPKHELLICPWCREVIKDENGKPYHVGDKDTPGCNVCANEVCADCCDSNGHCPSCSCFGRCDLCGEELEEGQIGLCDDCQKSQRTRKSARKAGA